MRGPLGQRLLIAKLRFVFYFNLLISFSEKNCAAGYYQNATEAHFQMQNNNNKKITVHNRVG